MTNRPSLEWFMDNFECPVCGSATCTTLVRKDEAIIGCDDCLDVMDLDAYFDEIAEEFDHDRED